MDFLDYFTWYEYDDGGDPLALWQERDYALFCEMAEGMIAGTWSIPTDEPAWGEAWGEA